MKVIVAGSRNFPYGTEVIDQVWKASGFYITELVSGGAKGVDTVAIRATKDLPIKFFLPDWETYGKAAGPIRNRQMAEYADALIAIWDGKSKGTKNMIEEMEKLGKPVFVYIYGE